MSITIPEKLSGASFALTGEEQNCGVWRRVASQRRTGRYGAVRFSERAKCDADLMTVYLVTADDARKIAVW
ncbi:MAG: hypothetical protein H8F28_17870 [Fibrella sp.]|nr:hypothetical protein [Armatimonadota bacterium]